MAEEREIHGMKDQLTELGKQMSDMKGTMAQIKEAIMGNPVSQDGGMASRIEKLEQKVLSFDRLKWIIVGMSASVGFSFGELLDKVLKIFHP